MPKSQTYKIPPSARKQGNPGKKIVVFMGHQAFGNFVLCQLVSAAIAQSFPGSKLLTIYRNDRPYKGLLNAINPFVTKSLVLPPKLEVIAPLDMFNGNGRLIDQNPNMEEYREFIDPDIMLTPSMMGYLPEACHPRPSPRFRIPENLVAPLGNALAAQGLDRKKWFAVLHIREGNYLFRRGEAPLNEEQERGRRNRDADPFTYLPMIKRTIHELGGQVVRVGDPSMTPLPAMEGLVDLSQNKDSFPLQTFALSRARFSMCSPSGPIALSCAFQTPTALVNSITGAVWGEGDVCLLKKTKINGHEIPAKDLSNLIDTIGMWPYALDFEDNSPEQLIEVADMMLERTTDCPSWRETFDPITPPDQATIQLPLMERDITAVEGVQWL